MTSLIAWVAVDSRGPSSCYLASDSRITWERAQRWEAGQKLFCGRGQPDLFGYAGDVLLPAIFLGQATRLLHLLSSSGTLITPRDRHDAFCQLAAEALEGYPTERRGSFSLLHCARESEGMNSQFHLWHTSWSAKAGWEDNPVPMPSQSSLLVAIGSGEPAVSAHEALWRSTSIGGTSRAVFGAFCEALSSGLDQLSGGAPQLVGLYRKSEAEHFGILYQGERFVGGLQITPEIAAQLRIEWRNVLFERCDPISMSLLPGAQRHGRPNDLNRGRIDSDL